jgi:quinolinate synthase
LKVVESIPKEQEILFAPDKNLGTYINKQTGRQMVLWNGACVVHEAFSLDKMITLKLQYKNAKIVAHPESEEQILKYSNFIGSTSEMINYILSSQDDVFIVATEEGILHSLRNKIPDKLLIPAPVYEDNICACGECGYMKINTLQKLHDCLLFEFPEILVSDDLQAKAIIPIEKMLKIKL